MGIHFAHVDNTRWLHGHHKRRRRAREMRDELVRRAAEADRSLSREIGRGLTRYLNEVPSGSQRRASVPPRAPAADIEGT